MNQAENQPGPVQALSARGGAGSLAAWSIGAVVLALLVLTLGVQLARSLLVPALPPGPGAAALAPTEPAALAAATVADGEAPGGGDRAALAGAWELYEAGLHAQARATLQELASRTGDPEAYKLLSRTLRRSGQLDAARRAQRDYRLARSGSSDRSKVRRP